MLAALLPTPRTGDDADKFAITATAGLLTFVGDAAGDPGYFRPNFEEPADKNKDNKYQVTVVATATVDPARHRKSSARGR